MSPRPALGQRGPSASKQSTRLDESTVSERGRLSGGGEYLLAAIADHGDRDAFRQIFEIYGPRIKRYVCARGAAETVAEEVVQEVMFKVWRRASLYDPARAGANTWIHSIARRCMLDRMRGERRPEVEDDDPNRVPQSPPDEDLALAENRFALMHAIEALPSCELDVLRAAYFEGLSMSEIAERQALPLGTVKTRTRNALERLRSLLRRTMR
jgi:RNA polymerase sigma-70 factor (ECF subfamily)